MTYKILGDPNRNLVGRILGGSGRGGFQWSQFIDFEGGNIVTPPANAWDSTGGAGIVTILTNAAAAIRGNFGSQVGIPGDSAIRYGIVNGLNSETQGTIQLLFDINSIVMADSNVFNLIHLQSGGAGGLFGFLAFNFTLANGYGFRLFARNDAGVNVAGVAGLLTPDEAKQLRFIFKQSSGPGNDDGFLRFYVNNVLFDSLENVDNDTQAVTELRLGAVTAPPAGVNGNLFFDNVSWSSQFI